MQNLASYTTSNFELFPEMMGRFMPKNSGTIDSRIVVNFPIQKLYLPNETIYSNISIKNEIMRAFLHQEQVEFQPNELDNVYFYQMPMSNVKDNTETSVSVNVLTERLVRLAHNIGSKLFEKLNWDQKFFMAKTAGVIEFEKSIDINIVYSYIKSYEP